MIVKLSLILKRGYAAEILNKIKYSKQTRVKFVSCYERHNLHYQITLSLYKTFPTYKPKLDSRSK